MSGESVEELRRPEVLKVTEIIAPVKSPVIMYLPTILPKELCKEGE